MNFKTLGISLLASSIILTGCNDAQTDKKEKNTASQTKTESKQKSLENEKISTEFKDLDKKYKLDVEVKKVFFIEADENHIIPEKQVSVLLHVKNKSKETFEYGAGLVNKVHFYQGKINSDNVLAIGLLPSKHELGEIERKSDRQPFKPNDTREVVITRVLEDEKTPVTLVIARDGLKDYVFKKDYPVK